MTRTHAIITYLWDWHGQHDPYECPIKWALDAYEHHGLPFEDLLKWADDTDPDWRDGFEQSIYKDKITEDT